MIYCLVLVCHFDIDFDLFFVIFPLQILHCVVSVEERFWPVTAHFVLNIKK